MSSYGLTPWVTIDDLGEATVVWRESDPQGRTTIWSSRWSGATWSPAFALADDGGVYSGNPRVVSNASGEVVAWWTEPINNSTNYLWTKRFRPDAGWSANQNALSSSWIVGEANIALDSSGNAVAAFAQYPDQSGFNAIWIARSGLTGPWSTSQRIDGYTGSLSLTDSPRIAPSGNGEFVSVWLDQVTNPAHVKGAILRADGGIVGPLSVDSSTTNNVRLAFSGRENGDAMAVWQQFRGPPSNGWDVFSARYTADAGFWPATAVELLDAGAVFNPSVAVDSSGRAAAAWVEMLNNNTPRAAVFDPTTGWQTVLATETSGTGVNNLICSMNAAGQGAIAWNEPAFTVRSITSTGTVSPKVALPAVSNIVGAVSIALRTDGAVLVIYSAPIGPAANTRIHAVWCQ